MFTISVRKARQRGGAAGSRRNRLRPTVMVLEGRELLSTITVSNTNDGGAGSLRAAIIQADADSGGDTIVFSFPLNTPETIALTGGSLVLTGTATTTITGPGANILKISGNKTSRVFDIEGGSAAISGLTISGGSADSGAGVFNKGGTLTLTDATLTGNSAADIGGGLATQSGGTTTLVDCTVSDNSAADSGGGLFDDGLTTTLTNCTVSGNTADSGGGLYNYFGETALTNCTVSGNIADQGGGLTDSGDPTFNPTITLTNTIVATQKAGADILVQAGRVTGSYNLIGDGSGISGGVSNELGTPQNPIDPLLAPLGSYGGPTSTMALLPGSPAIGAGAFNVSSVPATDQRGAPRGTVVDIGSVQNSLVVESPSGSVDTTLANLTLPGAVVLADQFAGADISFDPTVVTPQTIALSAPLVLSNTALTTTITVPTSGVTISGGNAVRVLQVTRKVTATLSGLTITAGFTTGYGGGVYNGGTLTLASCTVSGSYAGEKGGGLDNYSGYALLSLSDCTVSGNSAGNGGGGLFNGGKLNLAGCTVSGNSAVNDGGGLYNLQGFASLTGCTISGNSANQGGGLHNYGAFLSLSDCTVSGNRAVALGGGVCTQANSTTLVDCTVADNTAAEGGGVANKYDGTTTLVDCTVVGNSADKNGGGVLDLDHTSTTLINTIVAGQKAGGDITGLVHPGSSNNLVGNGAGMTGISNGSQGNQVGTAAAALDPLLGPLGDNGGPTQTFALLAGSPAIDKAGAVTGLSSAGVPNASSTSIPVPNGLVFAESSLPSLASGSYFTIQVDREQMAVVGLTLNNRNNSATLDVVRGVNGTAAAAHSGGAAVFLASDQRGYTRGSTVAPDIGAFQSQGVTLSAPPIVEVAITLDVVNQVDGLTSLRAAIAYANSHAGPDTIIFDPAYFGTRHRTIRLTGGALVLTDPATTTIIGPGARLLTISGGRRSRVFDIRGGSLALDGMTITGGSAVRGGGILNDRGALALDHVVLSGNRARVGGGLYNNGAATLSDVVIRGNIARSDSGLFSARAATLIWRGRTRSESTHPIVVDHFNGRGGIPTNWTQFEGQPGDIVEKPHNLAITDSGGGSAGIVSTARTVPFNPVGVKTTIVARINSVNSNGNAVFGLVSPDSQDSAAGYLAAGIDAHGNVFIASSVAATPNLTSNLIGAVKGYSGISLAFNFTINSLGVEVDGGGFKSGEIPFTDLSNFSLAAAFPSGNARPALGAASQRGQNGGSASFGSIRVSTALGG